MNKKKISLVLTDDDGLTVPIPNRDSIQVETEIDLAIVEMFNEICHRNNQLERGERLQGKFNFAVDLLDSLKGAEQNAD